MLPSNERVWCGFQTVWHSKDITPNRAHTHTDTKRKSPYIIQSLCEKLSQRSSKQKTKTRLKDIIIRCCTAICQKNHNSNNKNQQSTNFVRNGKQATHRQTKEIIDIVSLMVLAFGHWRQKSLGTHTPSQLGEYFLDERVFVAN